MDISSIRVEYKQKALSEEEVGLDPIVFFEKWFKDAIDSQISESNAMTLATVDDAGIPHARIVLLKEINSKGFVFFTNYQSNKGKQMEKHNKVSLLFFWKELERQVRIEGRVEKISAEESEEYFNSRPLGSRIGALASPQSQIIKSRDVLEKKQKQLEEQAASDPSSIQRPEHWGGYIVKPYFMEFWQGRESRLHDRIAFEKLADSNWKIYRLAP
ncbi:MAG TPA: pyridoxamine 5'-phosphate oxidase [Chitinophagaceae bacterium]|nr:pyridoxamine 5'-phosphate oxidase [Chitinophagaceae bacterium]